MLKVFIAALILFASVSMGEEIRPYGAVIKNKKTGDMIVANCHWLMDDKQQGKKVCLDMRMHLVDKKFQDIREITKIRSYDSRVNDGFPGTDEYIRTPLDFAKSMIDTMTRRELVNSDRDVLIAWSENQYRNIALPSGNEFNIHKYVGAYLLHLPKVIALYPFTVFLKGADWIHAKYIFPKKVKSKSTRFFDSLNFSLSKGKSSVVKMKNKDFLFALSILEN